MWGGGSVYRRSRTRLAITGIVFVLYCSLKVSRVFTLGVSKLDRAACTAQVDVHKLHSWRLRLELYTYSYIHTTVAHAVNTHPKRIPDAVCKLYELMSYVVDVLTQKSNDMNPSI